jgi:hypothetical protein
MARSATAVGVVVALLGLTAAACGDDPGGTDPSAIGTPSPVVSSDTSPSPSELCTTLLSDDVLATLGWPDPQPPGERAGRCVRRAESSQITVGERPDLVSGGDADQARRAYDEACVGLRRAGSPAPDPDTVWLGPDTIACFRPFPTGATRGFAELFVLTDDSAVVEVQVAAGDSTSPRRLEDALALLVPEVERTW